ncbi:pilin, partial [Patescibacteria group bacterium]|nr:pilin [Patescibacteria group bacterium]
MKKKSAFLFFILYSLFFIRPLLIPKQILGELTNPILPSPPSGLAGDTYISVLLSGLITAILVAGIVIFIFVFILGAIKWMTAGGDKANVQIAREKVTQALVGLSILLSIFVILNLVGYFFNIESLRSFPSINPGEPTPALTPCFDSDGGIDLYTYGWIRGTGDHCPLNYGVEYDSCNGDYIVEHFCNASNDCASIITECPVGGYDCSSGVCTGPSPTPISAPTPTPDP